MAGHEVRQSSGIESGPFHGYRLVISSYLIMAVAWGTFYSFGVFLKPVLAEFGWTRTLISGAYSLAVIIIGGLGMIMGGLSDRFGPRIILTLCGFFSGLGYLLMSQMTTLWQLYLFYGVLIAVGLSGTFAPLASAVARRFTHRRGLMTGTFISGVGIGTIFMPLLASQLIATYSWRTSFFIIGIISLVLIPLSAQFLKGHSGQREQIPHIESEYEGGLNSAAGRFSTQQAIRTRQFWILFTMSLCIGFTIQVTMVHLVSHTTDIGIPTIAAVGNLAIIGALGIIGRLVTGVTSDRIGVKLSISSSFILLSAALFWLLAVKELWMFYLFTVIFGFGYGGLTLTSALIAPKLFGLSALGAILGTVSFGYFIGAAIGPILAGRIFDITNNYYLAFLVCALLSAAGLVLTLLLKPIREKV